MALHPGDFIDYADCFATHNEYIKRILKNNDEPDFRMRDVEIYIRYIGFKFFINQYSGNLKKFLDDTCSTLNRTWDTIESKVNECSESFSLSCETTYEIFGDDAFHKWIPGGFETKFNRSVFDIMTYYFSFSEISRAAKSESEAVKEAFKKLCENDGEFLASLERTTKSIASTRSRYSIWGEALRDALPSTIINIHQLGD